VVLKCLNVSLRSTSCKRAGSTRIRTTAAKHRSPLPQWSGCLRISTRVFLTYHLFKSEEYAQWSQFSDSCRTNSIGKGAGCRKPRFRTTIMSRESTRKSNYLSSPIPPKRSLRTLIGFLFVLDVVSAFGRFAMLSHGSAAYTSAENRSSLFCLPFDTLRCLAGLCVSRKRMWDPSGPRLLDFSSFQCFRFDIGSRAAENM
jgi:hypothetical protein